MPAGLRLAPSFILGNRRVGEGFKVFVIAEIGVNHDGDPRLAARMIDAAARSGADSVKFQTFRAEEFMADREMEYEYRLGGRRVRERMFDMFKRLELPLAAYRGLFARARKRGMVPLTSVADPRSVAFVRKLRIAGLKLSSEDLINLPLVDCAARAGLPLILSTGMADAQEVADAARILARRGARRAAFLHCVSLYPTPDAQANLRRMLALRDFVRGPVGYSDHTEGIEACLGAVALGACVIEKHFTLDRGLSGPDHALSSDPDEFAALVRGIRRMELLRGSSALAPAPAEAKSRREFRRSIVAARDLPAGRVLARADLALKRPGTGLRARDIPSLCGKRLRRALRRDRLVLRSHAR